jgi:dihydroorotase-like cyclic amidohydrolase
MLPLMLSCVFADGPIDTSGKSRLLTAHRLSLTALRRLLFDNPNRIFSLGRRADQPPFIRIDPEKEWVIHGKDLLSKCKGTPYEGWTVRGGISWLL